MERLNKNRRVSQAHREVNINISIYDKLSPCLFLSISIRTPSPSEQGEGTVGIFFSYCPSDHSQHSSDTDVVAIE